MPRAADVRTYNSRVKIYTKTGDSGDTSLFDNTRVSKADSRVDAYGEVDELNACLGAARAAGVGTDVAASLELIQKDLFALGACLADPSARIAPRVTKTAITAQAVERLEQLIDRAETETPPLRSFILPGGSTGGLCCIWRARCAGGRSVVSSRSDRTAWIRFSSSI